MTPLQKQKEITKQEWEEQGSTRVGGTEIVIGNIKLGNKLDFHANQNKQYWVTKVNECRGEEEGSVLMHVLILTL